MSLDLRNFINININYNIVNISSVTRGIVTLITKSTAYTSNPYKGKIFYSENDFLESKKEKSIEDNTLDIYVKSFFGNRGKALQIIGGYQATGYSSETVPEFILRILQSLDYRYVIIVSDAEEQDLREAASMALSTNIAVDPFDPNDESPTVSTFSGLNEKYFISSTTDRSEKMFNHLVEAETFAQNTYYEFNSLTGQYDLLTSAPADWQTNPTKYFKETTNKPNNYVVKVGEKGIEMLAAAYLSKVKITDSSTIQDYAFTIEKVEEYFTNSIISNNNEGVNLIKGHKNFDTRLVNAIRNYPGDTISGADMMNYYIKILLTQDLSEAVMDLLASKIRFNQAGINRLTNTISQKLDTYISNGYLNTDYIWTDEDLTYSFNGVEYLICARNTPLVKGYKCVILPLTSLTSEQREQHVLPPVYLLLADQTGIRVIVINGDVF